MRQKHHNYFTKKREALIQKNLLATLAYSDIFDYPLTGEQLYQYVNMEISRNEFLSVIKKIPHVIHGSAIYYFLPKREKIVLQRVQREKISRRKLQQITPFLKILSFIPTISFIGVSGSLALLNADDKSDSDIFIITKNHTLWLTRLTVYGLLSLFSLKRTRKNIKNAICANMFLTEDILEFPKEKRNLYIAREIIQVIPISNKKKQHEKFLSANSWIRKYFPNFNFQKQQKNREVSFWIILLPAELLVRIVQLWYMKNKKTREITDLNKIAFHPIDYERIILTAYEKRKRQYKI